MYATQAIHSKPNSSENGFQDPTFFPVSYSAGLKSIAMDAFVGFRDAEPTRGSSGLDREAGELEDHTDAHRSSRRDSGRDSDRYREKSSRDRYRGRSRSRSPRRSRSRSRSGDRDRSHRDRHSPSRRSHRERGRDDRDYGSRSSRRDRRSPVQEDAGSSSGGGLRDMGLDETNKIRMQLGLPPLTADADEPAAPSNDAMDVDERPVSRSRPPTSQYSAEEDEEVDINSLSVEERILYLKKKRLEKAKQKRMQKTLADDDDDTDQIDDPLAWVHRSKQLEEERKKAAKKAKELFGDDEETEETSSKPAADSSGLKVNHDIGDFKAGETVILTLKDKQILDKGRLAADADDDELEAVAFVEEEKAKKYREAKQKKSRYVNFDDETDPRNASGILSKYDDDQKKGGFVIGAPDTTISASTSAATQDDDRVAQIRRKLMSEPAPAPSAAPSVKAPSLLDDFALPGAVGSDYYTAEETEAQQADADAAEKKKEKKERRQKKRKLRSRDNESTNDVFASLTPLGNEDAESELGSRADRQARAAQRELDQLRENASNMRKFEQAIENANSAVEASWFKGGKSGVTVLRHDEDAEELEYLKKLQRTKEAEEKDRESRLRADEDIVNKVAESLKRRKPLIDDDNIKLEDMDIETEDQGLTFTATDEFVRGIGSMQDVKEEDEPDAPMEDDAPVIRPPPAKRIKQEEPESDDMDLDEDVAGSSRASAVSGEEEEDEGVEAIMGPVRVESKGIAGFLSQLRSEGAATLEDYTTTYAGRVTDKKRGMDAIPSETADEDDDDPNVIHDPNFKFKFKLEYRDKQGRIQTKKEAWRELGQSFHNKKPGKKKLEQRLKREKEEIARKKKMTSDQALQSVQKLQKIQAKMQSPFVVVTSNAQKLVAMREGEKFKNVEIDEIPLRKPASTQQQKRPAKAAAAHGSQSSSSAAPQAQAAPTQQPPQNRPKIEIQLKPRPQQ